MRRLDRGRASPHPRGQRHERTNDIPADLRCERHRLSDPVFRWVAYVSIWAAITFIPATLLPFFKSGPFAWNGIIPFWLGGAVFAATFIVNTIWLLKAISAESSHTTEDAAAAVQLG